MMSIYSGVLAARRRDVISLGAHDNSLQRCNGGKNTKRELKSPTSSFSKAISSCMTLDKSLNLTRLLCEWMK